MNYRKAGTVFIVAGLITFGIGLFSLPINHAWARFHDETITMAVDIAEEEILKELGIEKDTDEYSDWLYGSPGYPLDQILYKEKMNRWLVYETLDTIRTVLFHSELKIYFLVIGIALYVGGNKEIVVNGMTLKETLANVERAK